MYVHGLDHQAQFLSGADAQGDGREQALLKHLQSDPALSDDANKDVSLQDRSQKVLDAIHEFGKGENKYLMSVGETKGKQVEALIKSKKPKVSRGRVGRPCQGPLTR